MSLHKFSWYFCVPHLPATVHVLYVCKVSLPLPDGIRTPDYLLDGTAKYKMLDFPVDGAGYKATSTEYQNKSGN